jgi:hypothetical protein
VAPLDGLVAIGAGAIAHDDLDGRMVLQPGGQGLGRAVGQQVDDPVTLQVAQDRAVALAFAPGPVINTQDTGRRHGLQRRFTDAAQQGRAADRHAGAGRQTRSRIAAQRQGDGVV